MQGWLAVITANIIKLKMLSIMEHEKRIFSALCQLKQGASLSWLQLRPTGNKSHRWHE